MNNRQIINNLSQGIDRQLYIDKGNITNVTKTIDISEDNYDIDVDYPIYFLNGQLLYKLNTVISTKTYDSVEQFLNIAKSFLPESKMKSELHGDYTTFTAFRRFITTKNDLYQFFSESAHPDHNILITTYDADTNKIITLQNLFIKSNLYLELLSRLSEKELKVKYPDLTYAFDSHEFRKGYAAVIDNFVYWALVDDGLLIFFPEYQVAPYAAGTLDILIPYKDIEGIITYDM